MPIAVAPSPHVIDAVVGGLDVGLACLAAGALARLAWLRRAPRRPSAGLRGRRLRDWWRA